MSLESIVEHILGNAWQEAEKIILQAKQEADKLTAQAKQEAAALYQEMIAKEKSAYDHERQRAVVQARLANRSSYLSAKQEIMAALFKKLAAEMRVEDFKKQQVSWDKARPAAENAEFLMSKIRLEHETEIAGILFGENRDSY